MSVGLKNFTHLHCHSHFSLLDGLSKIDPLVERAKEMGMNSLALTDHGVMYGAVEFYNKCKELDIKPIIGLEAYIAPRKYTDKEGKADSDYFHLTLLAKNDDGYKNLMLLTTIAHTEGFYYKPRIDLDLLKQHSQGLICLSGCMRGQIARAVASKSEKEAQVTLDKYLDIFGAENLFIEIQRNAKSFEDKQKEEDLNKGLIKLAKKNNLPIVATADCHYIDPEDSEAQDLLVCIGTGKTINDEDRLDMRGYDLSLKSPETMTSLFADLPEAVENTQKVVEMCELEIKINQRYFPKVEVPEGKTTEQFLVETVYEKALPLYGKDGVIPEDIKTRIDYELEIICKKGFDTYFLMVADVVGGAHEVGAITNTRGSAAGSIVGRILGITTVDPLYYELPFERFLTMHRPTPPDIDLDIADNKRDAAIEYITKTYGKDKVAQIITFGTMMARAAIRDVGRALGVSYSKCDRIAKMIPLGKQGFHMTLDKALDINKELNEVYEQDPETNKIIRIAKKLEGCARHASVHAAGIVITPTKLVDYMPLQKEPDGERIISQYDMYALDVNANGKAIGVVKLDLLGIRNLSILGTAVQLAEQRHGIKIDIYNLPHPDPKTFKLLSDGYTFGVFQLGSSGMTRYLKELKPSSVFDIMAMIALYRPGPLQFIPEYISRKHNPARIKYFDPAFEKILKRTYGVLVYQDDLLTIAHDLAGYSWEEVDKFRKAVGKKIPEEMAKQKIKFIEGCIQTSKWSRQKSEEIWGWIEPFAAYGFNKSHSASYAIVGYQTAYMKANFPVEFMAAVMTAESGDEDKIYQAVEECKNLDIQVLPPDVNESLGDFTVVDEKTIRFGLNAIKNLGSDVVDQIIKVRKDLEEKFLLEKNNKRPLVFNSLEDFLTKVYTKNLNKKSWEALVKAGALDSFGERGQLLANTEVVLEYLRENFKNDNSKQISLFGNSLKIGKLVLKPTDSATNEEKQVWEKEILGMYVSSHPLESYKKVLSTMNSIKSFEENPNSGEVVIGGITSRSKRILTKKNEPMAFFTIQDFSGSVEVLVFPKAMENAAPFLDDDKIIQIKGRLSSSSFNSKSKNSSYSSGELAEKEPESAEEFKVIAEEITFLPKDEDYNSALNEYQKDKSLTIHMPVLENMEVLNNIKEVLESHPGQAQVYLVTGSNFQRKTIKTQTLVTVSKELISELRTIPGIAKIDAE